MKKDHKRNHYIPKSILKYWSTEINSKKIVYLYDCQNKSKKIASATGRRAYKFAIVEDLYVPFVNGDRNVFMESELLHALEDKLLLFINHLHNQNKDLHIKNQDDINKIEMAIVSMSLRSRYNILKLIDYIDSNGKLKNEITLNPSDDTKKMILEMIINQIHDLAIKFHPIEILVYYFADGGLIYCDRPYVTINEFQFLGLTNKVFICFKKGKTFRFRYINGSSKTKLIFNNALALNSRDWIIAENEELLNKPIEIINSNKYNESINTDTIIHEEYNFIKEGWQFT